MASIIVSVSRALASASPMFRLLAVSSPSVNTSTILRPSTPFRTSMLAAMAS
jgi:hypothetical protein